MSDSSDRGRNFERKVAALLRSKLKIAVQRDRRSGANWTNRSDISDYWNELPLHLELKDQENIKVKEWFRQADAGSSFNKAPTLVFAMDEEILATLRFTDLLNFLVEITDMRAEIDDLRAPVSVLANKPLDELEPKDLGPKKRGRPKKIDLEPIVEDKIQRGSVTCREGHLADEYGYCMQKGCKYSRGYKKKKTNKK